VEYGEYHKSTMEGEGVDVYYNFILRYRVIPLYMSFPCTSNSPLRHFSRANYVSTNAITSDVTSLGYVTYVTIKGREINKLILKTKESLKKI